MAEYFFETLSFTTNRCKTVKLIHKSNSVMNPWESPLSHMQRSIRLETEITLSFFSAVAQRGNNKVLKSNLMLQQLYIVWKINTEKRINDKLYVL